jgi:hypothetical protein
MDLKHPWFNLKYYQQRAGDDSDDDGDNDVDSTTIQKRIQKFQKKQDNDATMTDEEVLGEAPLLHSEAQNLQAREQGYKSSLGSDKSTQKNNSQNGMDSKPSTSYEELSKQLESQYDYRSCSDCKIHASFVCIQCHDSFCAVCYASNHRRGRRSEHTRISLELYLSQRKHGILHEDVPHELPSLLSTDDLTPQNDSKLTKPPTIIDTSDYVDPFTQPIEEQNSGFLSGLTNLFGYFRPPPKANIESYDTTPSEYIDHIYHDEKVNPDMIDVVDNNGQTVKIHKKGTIDLPYRELQDDPTTLDGWWRGTPRHWLRGRAKIIPLRLTHEERYHLRLLISVLTSCDYLSSVDNNNNVQQHTTNIKKRNVNMVTNSMAVLTALIAAKSIPAAMEQNIPKYKGYLEYVLELGVRHYLRNQKQTGWISVLLSLLQDLQSQQVCDILGCKITITIRTVHTLLYPRNMLYVLDSNLMYLSTEPICVDTKTEVAQRISQRKSRAVKALTQTFAKQTSNFTSEIVGEISEQTLLLCLYSIGDHNINLHFTRDVCTRIGRILCGLYRWDHNYHIGTHRCVDNALINATDYASCEDISKAITVDLETILRIKPGDDVPLISTDDKQYSNDFDTTTVYNNDLDFMVHQCLATTNKSYTKSDEYQTTLHASPMFRTHTQHLQHVLQTVSLWETITHYLPFISFLSIQSYLDVSNNPYKLCNNGQGIVRVQPAMLLQRVMVALVVCALRGVGSGAVHIGDSSVPNSLSLIDKYLQLNTILTPLLSTARYWWTSTTNIATQEAVARLKLSTFAADCIQFGHRKLLQHWSINGMDGSGGDTVFTAGSCVDGRLTSVWNWCNMLPNQEFYPLFSLAGFTSFDQIQWD